MSSSATGVGMPICFLWAILLILTQKSSQKFGDVLGIMSRGAEKKVAKIVQAERNEACFNCRGAAYFIKRNRLALICDACKKQRTAPNQKDCPIFIKPYTME